jgi:hypothetical protein
MEETKKPRRKGPPDGHPKYGGGRRKGIMNKRTQYAHELAERMKVDPLQFMLEIVASTAVQVAAVNPDTGETLLNDDGSVQHTWIAVPLQMRLDAAKSLMSYLYPKLQAMQLTGANDGPIETTVLDVAEIMANPELAQQAQRLALMMSEQQADADGDARTGEVLTRERAALLPRGEG